MQSQREILCRITQLLGFKPVIDGLMSALSGKLVIDILAFDAQLQRHNPDYDAEKLTYQDTVDNLSMSEYIKNKFGEEAETLILLML